MRYFSTLAILTPITVATVLITVIRAIYSTLGKASQSRQ